MTEAKKPLFMSEQSILCLCPIDYGQFAATIIYYLSHDIQYRIQKARLFHAKVF